LATNSGVMAGSVMEKILIRLNFATIANWNQIRR
jgi:hypothetical protein